MFLPWPFLSTPIVFVAFILPSCEIGKSTALVAR